MDFLVIAAEVICTMKVEQVVADLSCWQYITISCGAALTGAKGHVRTAVKACAKATD